MAEIIKKSLVLNFGTTGSKELKLAINKPAEGLTGTQIATVMDRIIAAQAYGKEALVDQKLSAKYVVQQVDEVALV